MRGLILSFTFNSHAYLVILYQPYSDHALRRGTVFVFAVPSLCAGFIHCIPLDALCDMLSNLEQEEELKYDLITNPQQVCSPLWACHCVVLSMTPLHCRA